MPDVAPEVVAWAGVKLHGGGRPYGCRLPCPVRESILFRSVSAGAPEHLSLHTGEKTMHFNGQNLVAVHLRRKLVTIYFLAAFIDKLKST